MTFKEMHQNEHEEFLRLNSKFYSTDDLYRMYRGFQEVYQSLYAISAHHLDNPLDSLKFGGGLTSASGIVKTLAFGEKRNITNFPPRLDQYWHLNFKGLSNFTLHVDVEYDTKQTSGSEANNNKSEYSKVNFQIYFRTQ